MSALFTMLALGTVILLKGGVDLRGAQSVSVNNAGVITWPTNFVDANGIATTGQLYALQLVVNGLTNVFLIKGEAPTNLWVQYLHTTNLTAGLVLKSDGAGGFTLATDETGTNGVELMGIHGVYTNSYGITTSTDGYGVVTMYFGTNGFTGGGSSATTDSNAWHLGDAVTNAVDATARTAASNNLDLAGTRPMQGALNAGDHAVTNVLTLNFHNGGQISEALGGLGIDNGPLRVITQPVDGNFGDYQVGARIYNNGLYSPIAWGNPATQGWATAANLSSTGSTLTAALATKAGTNLFAGSNSTGLVAKAGAAGTNNFLREDGTWTMPQSGTEPLWSTMSNAILYVDGHVAGNQMVWGSGWSVTNIYQDPSPDVNANGAFQRGQNKGTATIGFGSCGADQCGFNNATMIVEAASDGSSQRGVNTGTMYLYGYAACQRLFVAGADSVADARGAGNSQQGTVGGSSRMIMQIPASGSIQAGYLDASCATNNGKGSLQLFNLSGGQKAYIASGADGSIGMGACIVTNPQSIVAGDGQVSHGAGSITAGGGFYGDGSGLTGIGGGIGGNWWTNAPTSSNSWLSGMAANRTNVATTVDGTNWTARDWASLIGPQGPQGPAGTNGVGTNGVLSVNGQTGTVTITAASINAVSNTPAGIAAAGGNTDTTASIRSGLLTTTGDISGVTGTLPAGALGTNITRTVGGIITTGNLQCAFVAWTNGITFGSGALGGTNGIYFTDKGTNYWILKPTL